MCMCVHTHIYHIFLRWSFLDGHLDYFHILPFANKCYYEHWIHVSFHINVFVFPDIYPGVELLDDMIVLFSLFKGTSILHSTVHACMLSHFSHVQLFVTLWLWPMRLLCPWGFSRQEHWGGLPHPPPGNLPTQRSDSCLLHLLHCHEGS